MAETSISGLLSIAVTAFSSGIVACGRAGPGGGKPPGPAGRYGRAIVPQELDVQPAQQDEAPGTTTPNPAPVRPAPSG
ncbi:hypothetical protein GCM10010116_13240 [Microbispora rosea subsp. aerata]|nr:hypothetical protein GCM10010116_13240 [Microbispora rosea subsp. aerata]GIH55069.1 hypothetical protein Mro02_19830 [Microbispora rosea subsp. aerata]GLJ82518.1 hypothetical protein GCM10017588_12430 [Microbispora rosea subsp. aerata]